MQMWPSRESAELLYDAANIALIVGLVIVFVATVLIVWMGNKKEQYSKIELSQTALLAAQATRIAEGEKLARVRIEQRLADRVLTYVQIEAISDKVRPFSGQEYEITTFWDLKEPLAIADRIHTALQLAGWEYLKPERTRVILGGREGVRVNVNPAADERTKEAAKSLVTALNGEDIASQLREQGDPNNPHNKIYLSIGTKP